MRDELLRDFSQAMAPPNTFASAAETTVSTFPASQPTGESVWPNFVHEAREYRQPDSNLTDRVDQTRILAENASRGGNIGPTPEAK